MSTVLYISYDGMTDPLGQSQVIPYLEGLSKNGIKFILISAEKPERLEQWGAEIQKRLVGAGIDWRPLSFTSQPPFLSKLWDLYRIRRLASQVVEQNAVSMVHCRSYVACDVGLFLKKKYGIKLLFDMRGFWADERVDSGQWDQKKWLYRLMYKALYHQKRSFEKFSFVGVTLALLNGVHNWTVAVRTHRSVKSLSCA